MAFGASSKIFDAFVENMVKNAVAYDLDSDTYKVALYDLTNTTPAQDAALANTYYGAGAWVSGATGSNEVYDAAEWPQTGQALAAAAGSNAFTAHVYKWDFDDEVSTGTSATLANVGGCLIYSDTLANKNGICYLSFGGSAQSVVDGTFTVVFNASGAMTITI